MLLPNGIGRTKLTIDYFEKRLGDAGLGPELEHREQAPRAHGRLTLAVRS